eukprot:gene3690-4251_t
MDRFLVVKSINPAFKPAPVAKAVVVSTEPTVNKQQEDVKQPAVDEEEKKKNKKVDVVVDKEKQPTKPPTTPKKKKQPQQKDTPTTTTAAATTPDTTTATTATATNEKNEDDVKSTATPSKSTATSKTTKAAKTTKTPAKNAATTTATTTTATASAPQSKPDGSLHQTCLTNFFKPITGDDTPVWKYLFEKEAAERAERQRLEQERAEREQEELRKKKAAEKKKRAEQKKIRDEERRIKEEEEWEEYQLIQEQRTKGVEIIPRLYLGSFVAAKNEEWLKEANVGKIVNVTSEVKCYFTKDTSLLEVASDEEEEVDEVDEVEEEEEEEEEEDDVVDMEVKDSDDVQATSTTTDVVVAVVADKEDADPMDIETKKVEEKEKSVEVTNQKEDTKEDIVSPDTKKKEEEKKEEEEEKEDIKLNIEYLRIPIADSSKAPIDNYFDEACQFIKSTLKQEKDDGCGVLVHCKQGRSRSPSIIIAYLMKVEGWTLEKAWNHITKLSSKSLTVNEGFKLKLMHLEKAVHKTNSLDFYSAASRTDRAATNTIRDRTAALGTIRLRRATTKELDNSCVDDEDDLDVDINDDQEDGASTPSPVRAITSDPADEEDVLSKYLVDDVSAPEEEKYLVNTLEELKVVKRRRDNNMVIDD